MDNPERTEEQSGMDNLEILATLST